MDNINKAPKELEKLKPNNGKLERGLPSSSKLRSNSPKPDFDPRRTLTIPII